MGPANNAADSKLGFLREHTQAWDWTAKQFDALCCLIQFLLYGGAKGGGKSFFLCRWAVFKCAQFIGNKVFLARKRSVDFTRTTLMTFKKSVPSSLYILKEQKKQIILPWCDGTIEYGGLDDPDLVDKFNSYETGAIGIDQAEEITKDQLGSLVGTLRHRLPDGRYPDFQVRLTANPAEMFLKYMFPISPLDKIAVKGKYAYLKALHSDNPFLPPTYVENLTEALKHRPQLLEAYIKGLWDNLSALDTLIQPSWIHEAVGNVFKGRIVKRVVVCDVAREGDDECVIYVMEQNEHGQIRIVYEKIEGFTDNLITLALRLIALRRHFDATLIVVDAVGLGAGVFDYIRKIKTPDGKTTEPVFPYKGGASDMIPEIFKKRYANLKSWAWHYTADLFRDKTKICLPNDEGLISQLQWQKSVLVSEILSRVLPRKELKVKYQQSPDRAEAFVMGVHGLRIAPELPYFIESTPAQEFWDRVKKDIETIQHGDKQEKWQEIT